MDKIEVTQNARQAAFDAYLTYYEIVPNDLWMQALLDGKHDGDEMAQAFARFERDILATRTDATPVAWMYEHPDRECGGTEIWPERHEYGDGWTETPLYTHPPATDVAALVEAAKAFAEQADMYDDCEQHPNGCPDNFPAGEMLSLTVGDFRALRQALAPFTKGQP